MLEFFYWLKNEVCVNDLYVALVKLIATHLQDTKACMFKSNNEMNKTSTVCFPFKVHKNRQTLQFHVKV